MEDNNPILDAPSGDNQQKSKSTFRTGVSYVIALYGAGCVLAGLSYLIVGHPYIHAPGLHHLILFITVAVGFCWVILAGIKALIGRGSTMLKGTLVANAVVLVGVACYVYTIAYEESEPVAERTNEIIMKRNGDTTTLYHDGNPLYMKVGDSVLFNAIDSTNLPPDLVLVEE